MYPEGTPLVAFNDFVLATKSHKITPTTEILNDSARRSYFLAMMLKGRGYDEVIQSGRDIIDHVRLAKHNAAGYYLPNENLQPRGMDVLTQVKAPWRFHQGNYAWSEHQVELQVSNGGNPADFYTRLKTAWEQASKQDIWDSLEEGLWNTPDNTNMEQDGGKLPYSIPTFVTSDGLAPAGFTTVSGIDPSTQTKWRNQTDTLSWAGRGTNDALYQAFDRMWRKLRWKRIPRFNSDTGTPSTDFDKVTIATTTEGVNGYLGLNRSANDRLRQDPRRGLDGGWMNYGDNPTFNNIPLDDVERLDETTTVGQPPFYWLNLEYLFPVWHANKYMEEVGPIRGSINQPFSWAVYFNTYLNLFCRSRRRQGMIQCSA